MQYKQGQELREFNRLYKKMEELYHGLALKLELSDSAFVIFYTICEIGDGCSQKLLCQELSMSKQTVNSAMRKLEQRGYVCLKKGKDGRERQIFLTEKGENIIKEKIHPVMEMEDRVFVKMPREEREEFLRLTRKYVLLMTEEVQRF